MIEAGSDDGRVIRDVQRTRARVLAAATEVITVEGTAASIARIAEAAGVTKGAVLHHFGNREALLVAVVDSAMRRLREHVIERVDLSENHPGKLLRAYIRTLTEDDSAVDALFASAGAWGGLASHADVAILLQEDETWWQEQLPADGMDPARIEVIRRAAEGMAAAVALGVADVDYRKRMRLLLLELSSESGPLR